MGAGSPHTGSTTSAMDALKAARAAFDRYGPKDEAHQLRLDVDARREPDTDRRAA